MNFSNITKPQQYPVSVLKCGTHYLNMFWLLKLFVCFNQSIISYLFVGTVYFYQNNAMINSNNSNNNDSNTHGKQKF